MNAARELFSEFGYEATKTQDIAARAGVTHRLLFTNIGSKAGLFNAAISEPLSKLFAEYAQAWDEHPQESTPEQRIRRVIIAMYDFARVNRVPLRAALSGPRNGQSAGEELLDEIAKSLHKVISPRIISRQATFDPTALLIDIAGMAFGVALLDDMLIPRGTRRPSRARLLDEMIATATYGVLVRPDDSPDDQQRCDNVAH